MVRIQPGDVLLCESVLEVRFVWVMRVCVLMLGLIFEPDGYEVWEMVCANLYGADL